MGCHDNCKFEHKRAGGGTKARYLKHIIAREGAVFVCLQETKAVQFSDARCYSLWGDNKAGWVHYEGDNGGGSLLSLWHTDAFIYDSHIMGKGFIAVSGQHVKANYFNAVRSPGERKGTKERGSQLSEIREFNRFIDANLLIELPFVGKSFTWFSSNGKAKSRLDRILVSEEWMQVWPSCKQYVQRREVFDHCALVVKSVDKDWGPKPFRTIDAWLVEKGFMEMVKDRWNAYVVQGSSFTKVKDKLKRLKGDLKIWNKDIFGNLESTKKRILQEIEDYVCQDCNDNLLVCDRMKRFELVGQRKEVDNKLESLMRQKSRVSWLKNGDSCTKFFYSSLKWRRSRNQVKGVEVGGLWCEEPSTVRAEARRWFDNRFRATRDLRVRLDAVEFKSLSLQDNLRLIEGFSETEVRDAM
ncbi:uncharacterized protein [Phaseolus vulgaris]|uniref:uncharacterized protein n=1 Tax=Phaseolus vulgaris TaxID=3885 RepID=UPI0035CC1E19